MSLTKRNIVNNISLRAHVSNQLSSEIFETFLIFIKNSFSTKSTVKIAKFGTFKTHSSAKRLGRNPKTKKTYEISSRKKLNLQVSNHIKKILN